MGRKLSNTDSAADSDVAKSTLARFRIEGPFSIQPFGSGHVHDTFRVHDGQGSAFLLQRINHAVFTDVEGMMRNIYRVTQHLHQKIAALPDHSSLTTFRVVLTRAGKLFYQDAAGNYWRVFTFIDGGMAYDITPSAAPAREAGRAFGQFQALLLDLPGTPLIETIPKFHHLSNRFTYFEQALAADRARRVSEVSPEVAFVRQRAPEMLRLHALIDSGQIRSRITHNDTKLNNVLLDPVTHRARAVVDLDTVMPGSVLHDFGDAIRTVASTAAEDEVNLSQVQFHLPYYEAFAEGYLAEASAFLTAEEIVYLPLSARYMAFIMGVRMLTDYLVGDTYYKTAYPSHNLDRARNQFWLIEQMEAQRDTMAQVVDGLEKSEGGF